MTASADARPPISNMNGLRSDCALKAKMDDIGLHRQGTFKKHKVLPHPRNERAYRVDMRSRPRNLDMEVASVLSQGSTSQASISSVSLRRTPRRIVAGPDLPPTPPAHSRTSSSSHSVLPSSPTYVASPGESNDSIREPPPATPVTPTNQRSPPTPNLTPEQSPPGKASRRPKPRPAINDRMPSKATTMTDSRTESFKTAREEPETESEEDVRSTVRPMLPSAQSSHSTVRRVSPEESKPKAVGLGLGMESSQEDNATPRTKGEFMTFDGDWGSSSEVEQEWDDNLNRTVTVRKRRPAQTNGVRDEVVEDVTVTPTNATKALRSVSLALQESPVVYPARRVVSDRTKPTAPRAPTASESSISVDTRRASGISTKSTVSTVVEAILVDTPPARRKTLRHVRKQSGLRDSALELPLSSTSSVQSPLSLDEAPKRPTTNDKRMENRVESMASTSTHNSISSRKARRAIEKSGAIPVVVIPDRRSSNKSSKEPSLRSTSSRRSKRSQSLGSAPISQLSMSKDTPIFERPGRRSRTLSESDGSRPGDQRTMDFPPVVPVRSSSLSAPTSRNGSRTGSLTADSLKAHNALQAERARKALEGLHATRDFAVEPATPKQLKPALPTQSHGSPSDAPVQQARSFESGHHLRHVDHLGDPFFGQRLSVQKTPFSLASVDTTGTFNAEVAEAQAVSIYPHQNKSILVVEHSNRPSENSSLEQKSRGSQQSSSLGAQSGDLQQPNPTIKTTAPDSSLPVTPPQPNFKMDDVDSPLRNPRAPPEPPAPPAIALIPATPSGLTPANQKENMMGNYFGVVVEKPQRPVSLLKRALTGRSTASRRFSESGASSPGGILSRTFSLSRHPRRKEPSYLDRIENEPMYPTPEDRPREENKLHAFWRPARAGGRGEEEDDDDWVRDVDDDEEDERTYRYPPVDNRPTPRRTLSLSDRVKRTFAILPSHDAYYESESGGTARRTIRRTPSGSLRVVKQHRRSLDSLRAARPYSPPVARGSGGLWRTYSLGRTLGRGIERYGLHNIPRRLSERRREKRSRELRGKISGPREVRDGVGDVIKRAGVRDAFVA